MNTTQRSTQVESICQKVRMAQIKENTTATVLGAVALAILNLADAVEAGAGRIAEALQK